MLHKIRKIMTSRPHSSFNGAKNRKLSNFLKLFRENFLRESLAGSAIRKMFTSSEVMGANDRMKDKRGGFFS